MKELFKAGDKVYCPSLGREVYTVKKTVDSETFTLSIEGHNRQVSFTCKGMFYSADVVPSIFHATEESRALLEKLYGVEFEKPVTPKDIIQALLKHNKYVPCCVSNKCDEVQLVEKLARGVSVLTDFIHTVDNGDFPPYTAIGGTWWRYAVPIDLKTGEIITELPTE